MQFLGAALLFKGNHSTLLWILNLKEGIDGSVAYSVHHLVKECQYAKEVTPQSSFKKYAV